MNVIVNKKFWSLFCVTSLENIECFQLTSIFLCEKYTKWSYVHPHKKKTKALTKVILFSILATLYQEKIRGNF